MVLFLFSLHSLIALNVFVFVCCLSVRSSENTFSVYILDHAYVNVWPYADCRWHRVHPPYVVNTTILLLMFFKRTLSVPFRAMPTTPQFERCMHACARTEHHRDTTSLMACSQCQAVRRTSCNLVVHKCPRYQTNCIMHHFSVRSYVRTIVHCTWTMDMECGVLAEWWIAATFMLQPKCWTTKYRTQFVDPFSFGFYFCSTLVSRSPLICEYFT